MVFKSNGLTNSRWASANYQQAPRYPLATPATNVTTFHHPTLNTVKDMSHHNHDLDPSVPNFQPSGTEVQRYQAPATSPLSQGSPQTPTDITQMQHYVLNNHFAHTKAVAGLERQNQKTRDDIENMKEVVGRDVRGLENQIDTLRQEVVQQRQKGGSVPRMSRGDHGSGFSYDNIVDRYLDEADDLEKTAEMLRKQAKQMSTAKATKRLVKLKLLDAPGNGGESVSGISQMEHACCGQVFASVGEMLDHVSQTHGIPSHIDISHGTVNGLEDENNTPAHIPPRRVKMEKDQAVPEVITSDHDAVDAGIANGDEPATPEELATHTDNVKETTIDAAVAKDRVQDKIEEEMPTPTVWIPLAVRNMPPPPQTQTDGNAETFTWEFLVRTFGGKQWSPSYYFIPHDSDLPSKSYWVLDTDFEPFLPSTPGQHGAKLTAFFNDAASGPGEAPLEENFLSVPVFIRGRGENEYVYFGQYSQTRFSDKLSHAEVMEQIPEGVREYWAQQLADKGRPAWITEALMQQFWPKPAYEGPIPNESSFNSPASTLVGDDDGKAKPKTKNVDRATLPLETKLARALVQYAEELSEWRREAEMKVNLLTADALMKAFEGADADEEPGLRLWWEYLECVGYDHGFYDYLVAIKRDPGLRREAVAVTASKGGKKSKEGAKKDEGESEVGGKVVKADPGKVETLVPAADDEVLIPSTSIKAPPHDLTKSTTAKTHLKSTKPNQQPLGNSNGAKNDTKVKAAMPESSERGRAKLYQNFTTVNGGQGGTNGAQYLPPHLRRGGK